MQHRSSNHQQPFQQRFDLALSSSSETSLSSSSSSCSSHIRFARPLLEEGYPEAVQAYENGTLQEKPLLIYLPGFDGSLLAPYLQFPELGTIFDVRGLTVSPNDRSSFQTLVQKVVEYILNEIHNKDEAEDEEEEDYDDGDDYDEMTGAVGETTAAERSKSKDFGNESKRGVVGGGGGGDGAMDTNNSTTTTTTTTATTATNNNPLGSWISNLLPKPSNNNKKKKSTASQRPIFLMGESFGGILALEVALTLRELNTNNNNNKDQGGGSSGSGTTKKNSNNNNNLSGLVLINPATCYDRSKLALEGPIVAKLPSLLYPIGLVWKLLPLFTDDYSFAQLLQILQTKALPSLIDSREREAFMGRLAFSLPYKLQYLPRPTLEWRLRKWLETGCAYMATKTKRESLETLNVRTLVVAGERDKTLPSIAEAERLLSILPDAKVHVVERAGHASTCGSHVDLAALFRDRFPPEHLKIGTGAAGKKNGGGGGRTAMKEEAANNEGILFGMVRPYHGQDTGLSPFLYWSKPLYQKWIPKKTKKKKNKDGGS